MRDLVLKIENLLSKDECQKLINTYKVGLVDDDLDTHMGYQHYDITLGSIFFDKIDGVFDKIYNEYEKQFSEIKFTTDRFSVPKYRFKHFPPGKNFDIWHSEHQLDDPYRVLNFMLYLSDHNCGTEFYNGDVVKSVAGTGALFPSYFTHTHKGQVCPDGKDRYLITGYLTFINGI